jgi:peptide/nickel transport system ATP-binding protein
MTEAPSSPLISIRRLSVPLPGNGSRAEGVRDVSIDVLRGQTHCLVGESGSGKSLTALSVLGLLPPRFVRPRGNIMFEGRDLLSLSPKDMRQVRGNRIGMIFQEPMTALNPLQRVGRQIDEVLRFHTEAGAAERHDRVVAMLNEVNLPAEATMARYPHELSGGQRQRVMIAIALILEPRLLIADEPTTALDVTTQAQILKLIKQLQHRHGTGVLFITHDFGVVSDIADAVTVMCMGRMVEAGPVSRVLRDPVHAYTRALLDAVPKGVVPQRSARAKGSESALEVVALRKTYRRSGIFRRRREAVAALDDVGFRIDPGEILGIVGESGSGKSTAARCIARLLDVDSGNVALGSCSITSLKGPALRLARRDLQVVFQDPYGSLNPRRKVGRIIAEGLINFGVSPAAALARAGDLLVRVGLEARDADRYPSEFSGGQRQRISLARALAPEPKVLIADEAVSALDVSIQAQILRLLLDIREAFGLSILFITHDLRVAAELCDRIVVMQNGRIVEQGSTADVLLSPLEPYTRALIDAVPGKRLTAMSGPPAERVRQ